MTSQELLVEISRRPDDDEPRLAYAQAVQRIEPEYAEFVRLQIARAADERTRKARRDAPSARELELLRIHGYEWTRYIEKYVRPSRTNGRDQGSALIRGFVGFVRMEPENFVALGTRLFDMAPVQHADLYGGEDPVRPLFEAPGLARLDSLSLRGAGLDDDDAIALAASPHLARVTWLDLGDNRIGNRGVEALAAAPTMANKVIVRLDGNPGDPAEVPHYDWDGSIADVTVSPLADEIEARLGRIAWFHYDWRGPNDEPDRFHARWAR
jgi:uncharacterized protein (TIGR02996 family)